IEQVMPNRISKIKLYEDTVPMFNRFQIENQIESAYRREVQLPSGGSIVVDHTEALISIDINSARATKGSDIEETATNTNLEAADEVARQLRLRDLGGLVVIDFIDMMSNKNQRNVENRLRDAVAIDRARVQIGRISRFGLMEMSRQRLKPSLGEATQIVCPRCTGNGTIRTVESLALSLVRIAEEEALKESTGRVEIHVPVDVATFMLNEKRKAIADVEAQTGVHILVIASTALETPQYRVERVRKADMPESSDKASYQQAEVIDQSYRPDQHKEKLIQPEKPAVASITPSKPKPPAVTKSEKKESSNSKGFIASIVSLFKGDEEEELPETKKPKQRSSQGGNRGNRGGRGRSQRGNRNRRPAQNKQEGSKQKTAKGDKKPAPKEGDKPADAAKDQGQSSRRGRRGGGRRRDTRNKPAAQEGQNQQNQGSQNQSESNQGASAKSAPTQQAPTQSQPAQAKQEQTKPVQSKPETKPASVPQSSPKSSSEPGNVVDKPKREISGNISPSAKAAVAPVASAPAAASAPKPAPVASSSAVAPAPKAVPVAPAPAPAKENTEKAPSGE
ncbi:MAG: ribonuclease E/G, partial [Gammaproteobacteria bacterium]|nr:ribonuclease E/G [Gammaproteobacteria bacterium]